MSNNYYIKIPGIGGYYNHEELEISKTPYAYGSLEEAKEVRDKAHELTGVFMSVIPSDIYIEDERKRIEGNE